MNSPPELSVSIWCQRHLVTASAYNQCVSINYTIRIGSLTSEELYDKQKCPQSWPLNTCRSSFGELVKANSNVQFAREWSFPWSFSCSADILHAEKTTSMQFILTPQRSETGEGQRERDTCFILGHQEDPLIHSRASILKWDTTHWWTATTTTTTDSNCKNGHSCSHNNIFSFTLRPSQ